VIEAFVALGSNLGDRLANLGAAVELIAREPGFSLRKVSLAYETEPVGPPQPRYLNAVAQVGTLLTPRATLQRLHWLEDQLGRVRGEQWGAREIDLDLLLYGDRVLEGSPQIPHPRMQERAFVLVPLVEIAPQTMHPLLHATAVELLGRMLLMERARCGPIGSSAGRCPSRRRNRHRTNDINLYFF
jgi:2-amino-4-hydroxy-6-hydroxymethyldihydropteridine diphosphokinase